MTTTTPSGRPRSPRRSTEEKQQIARLLAARDRLDADQADRRRREEAAFAEYAVASTEIDEIANERDSSLAALDAQRAAIVHDSQDKIAAAEGRQGAVLVELNELGRSAEELSALFGIPTKRVRSTIRDQRQTQAAGPLPTPATAKNVAAAADADSAPTLGQPDTVGAGANGSVREAAG